MTAIRKSGLQYVHFQCFTSKTTKIGYSNDRFGFMNTMKISRLETKKGTAYGRTPK